MEEQGCLGVICFEPNNIDSGPEHTLSVIATHTKKTTMWPTVEDVCRTAIVSVHRLLFILSNAFLWNSHMLQLTLRENS